MKIEDWQWWDRIADEERAKGNAYAYYEAWERVMTRWLESGDAPFDCEWWHDLDIYARIQLFEAMDALRGLGKPPEAPRQPDIDPEDTPW